MSAGATVNYTVTVTDGNGAGVSGASVTVTNPFTGTNSTVTTTAGGSVPYSLTVPSSQGAATYTVFFSGASEERVSEFQRHPAPDHGAACNRPDCGAESERTNVRPSATAGL